MDTLKLLNKTSNIFKKFKELWGEFKENKNLVNYREVSAMFIEAEITFSQGNIKF